MKRKYLEPKIRFVVVNLNSIMDNENIGFTSPNQPPGAKGEAVEDNDTWDDKNE